MSQVTDYQHVGLVGIKGVGMTALAQCLLDLGISIIGYDVNQDFVTEEILIKRQIKVLGLNATLDPNCQCLIYSAAYDPSSHPLILQAATRQLPILSLAEALSQLFNQKAGIAVCGVGGKSSVSAWITWLLDQTGHDVSAAIGVGSIPGLNFTGRWHIESPYFVAEADEYAQNPMAVRQGESLQPRFMALKPQIIVCTNLKFDHPDVYHDFDHTQAVFSQFFHQLRPDGTLIYNQDDLTLAKIAETLFVDRPDVKLISFGHTETAQVQLIERKIVQIQPRVTVKLNTLQPIEEMEFSLTCPGQFFALNSLAVIATGLALNLSPQTMMPALTSFRSVSRRFESRGEWRGVKLYDDYAHTPHELSSMIESIREITDHQVIVCFQPHTFSRTKAYLSDFVDSLARADKIILLPIFPSAREAADPSTSSDQIGSLLKSKQREVHMCQSFEDVVKLLPDISQTGDVFATLGAGDVYQIIDLLKE